MSVKYYHIVATSADHVIGVNNTIPWSSKMDMDWFRKTTYKRIIVMGRKTYESLPVKLRDRWILVLTRNEKDISNSAPKGEKVFFHRDFGYGLQHVMNELSNNKEILKDKIFIVGGAEIYDLTASYIAGALVSQIDMLVPVGDTFYKHHLNMPYKQQLFTNLNVTDDERNDPLENIHFFSNSPDETWS